MSITEANSRLTPLQLGLLVILMAEAREVTNNELKELAGFSLTGADRRALLEQGLIEERKAGRSFAFQLTDKGWHFCKQLHDSEVNVGKSTAARSIFVLLGGVHRSLDRLRLSHADFFKQAADGLPEPRPEQPNVSGDVPADIRAAYRDLVRRPGQWLSLADLRDRLAGLDRVSVDEALVAMAQLADVRIIPVANSKALDSRDRAAALRMGGEDHHALSIGSA